MATLPDDYLALGQNKAFRGVLASQGNNKPQEEVVIFSDNVVKINRKGKKQTRVLVVTDKALYNVIPQSYGDCRRRISLEKVAGCTASQVSDEFVVHVPDEYDYRWETAQKDRIVGIIKTAVLKMTGKKIMVAGSKSTTLEKAVVTKDVAKLQSREQRLARYKQLMAAAQAEDADDEKEAADGTLMYQSDAMPKDEKVSLSDFDFLKVIGRGSFGKVMLVQHKKDKGIYAMKILKKRAIVARSQVEHTRAERQILEAAQHPFLMGLRYAFQTNTKLYMVLNYFKGGELFFHLRKKRKFNETIARIWVMEVVLAMGHLHKMNMLYRDLKPENILLDETGHICLTDFGLSVELTEDKPKATTFCGTPEYLAPEIVKNQGHGKPVDWWSVGILLYELTVGIPPFYSNDVNTMYKLIVEKKLVILSRYNLSPECQDVIHKLLERNPDKRLGSSQRDYRDIIEQPFFASIDEAKLLAKQVEVPYKPDVGGDTDTSNFDTQFTDEPVRDSYVPPSKLTAGAGFEGFTFVAKKGPLGGGTQS